MRRGAITIMVREERVVRTCVIAAATLALLPAPAAQAQQWLVNSVINNAVVETAICDSALKKHQKLPDICAKYPKYSGAGKNSGGKAQEPTAPQASAGVKRPAAGSGRFIPDAGDDSLRQLADSAGTTAEEKQQLLQLAQAGKALFDQKYGPKGWKNDLAGAYAFFIVAISTVYNDREPDGAAQDRLFEGLSATLAQTPDVARTSARDKTALYNTLIAGGGLPLLFYIDGKQQNNATEIAQAKAVAAEFSRKILNTEPQALATIAQ
jgi:hypothetical protein